jgi:hypothetical protein
MALAPITGTVRGDDLTPRFVRTSTVVASPTDNTETIIASLTLTDTASPVAGVELIAFAAFTIGTNGTAGNLRIRRTDASGSIVAATGGLTAGVWAATQLAELYVAGFDTGPTLPGQVYVATLTVTSGSAASTVSALYLRALTV